MDLNKKIGLGTVQFGTKYGISNTVGKTSNSEVTRILDFARNSGIQIIDTASAYGNAEYLLGLNNINKFKIISKFFPPSTNGKLKDQFNRSISKLKVDALYGYLAHRPQSLIDNSSDWEELLELKKKGLVEKIGYSLNNTQELKELVKKGYLPDIIQIPFNLFDHRFKEEAIILKEKGCEIHARSSFLQGLFFMDTEKLPVFFDTVKDKIDQLQNIFKENLANALLNHSLNQNFIDYVMIGVENKKQLFENVNRSKDIAKLNEDFKISDNILIPSNWPKT
jgi:aryl-alcohol dehydrogenase-like predicted oxidoreductase